MTKELETKIGTSLMVQGVKAPCSQNWAPGAGSLVKELDSMLQGRHNSKRAHTQTLSQTQKTDLRLSAVGEVG